VGEALGYSEYQGTVRVTLEISEHRLTSVLVHGPFETAGLGSVAIDSMGPAMLAANSIVVDVVSGATETSEAVLLAAEKALARAGLRNSDLQR
jgi:fumarate reductase flavoprotein subunit